MKIVHVLLGTANPDTMNGVNKVVHHLATAQHRAHHDVEVWSLTDPKKTGPTHPHAYPIHRFPTTKTRFLLSPILESRIRGLSSDTWVHLHSVFIPEFRAIAGSLHRRKIAFGVTPHGGYSRQVLAKGRIKKAVYMRFVEAGILRRARLLQAIGQSEVDDFHRLTRGSRIVLLPNGQEPLSICAPADPGYDDPRPVFCFCGRLAMESKGLDLLLAGFELYMRRGGTGSLWFIGDGIDRPALEAIVGRLGLAARVRFHGARFGAEKLGLLASSDGFVHPSRWDAVPTAALEAAAVGLPLLISRETNIAGAVEAHGAGIVLAENTPEDIGRGMERLEQSVSDGAALVMAQGAKEMIADRFSWPSLAANLVSAYRAAMTEDGRHA